MKKYLDRRRLQNGCVGVIATDDEGKPIEIIQAGTTINSMSPKHKSRL